jgi:hypothetical protein
MKADSVRKAICEGDQFVEEGKALRRKLDSLHSVH